MDFIHSCLVLQHIETKIGYQIIRNMLTMLAKEGIIAIQIPIHRDVTFLQKLRVTVQKHFPIFNILVNFFANRPALEPLMQMNVYNLNKISNIFYQANIKDLDLIFERDNSSNLSCYLIGKKS